jgi:hypothetical protein
VTDPEDFGHRHMEVTAESAEVAEPYPDTDERRRLAERIPDLTTNSLCQCQHCRHYYRRKHDEEWG